MAFIELKSKDVNWQDYMKPSKPLPDNPHPHPENDLGAIQGRKNGFVHLLVSGKFNDPVKAAKEKAYGGTVYGPHKNGTKGWLIMRLDQSVRMSVAWDTTLHTFTDGRRTITGPVFTLDVFRSNHTDRDKDYKPNWNLIGEAVTEARKNPGLTIDHQSRNPQ